MKEEHPVPCHRVESEEIDQGNMAQEGGFIAVGHSKLTVWGVLLLMSLLGVLLASRIVGFTASIKFQSIPTMFFFFKYLFCSSHFGGI